MGKIGWTMRNVSSVAVGLRVNGFFEDSPLETESGSVS